MMVKIDWKEELKLNEAHLEAINKVAKNHLDEYRKYFDDALKQEGVKDED